MKPKFDGQTGIDDLKKLPELPGVYFFLDGTGDMLYIGKATILRDRVRSYLSSDILDTRGPKIAKMLALARCVAWRVTDSVLEALILESRLIKMHQPPYNTDAKDDKSYNHVVITEEEFPRVMLVRGRDLSQGKFTEPIRSVYGPFPHGAQLTAAMKIVRRIFPYRDKCVPANGKIQDTRYKIQKKKGSKPCFHRQIGLCPGVCTGEISAREYGKTIRRIRLFFDGKKAEVVRRLEREMMTAAKGFEFEKAGRIRNTIFALGHIREVSLLGQATSDKGQGGVSGVRIEAYDAAHLGGKSSVGVMTVCHGETPDRSAYRKFLLRGAHAGNDLSALGEILKRRLKHGEWPRPDIVAVDGNANQFRVAETLLAEAGWGDVRIVGIVKNAKHQPERLIGDGTAIAEYRRAILLCNAEAHRFALSYHRKRRENDFGHSMSKK
ncbi:MAG: UvrB/UvrC motif-containing protein [Candidatus Moranbacteria bacterium]|nr:UvrB/UvrC motif-containing protein [Candidatus Moranbacteria bacterium]